MVTKATFGRSYEVSLSKRSLAGCEYDLPAANEEVPMVSGSYCMDRVPDTADWFLYR
jgi:hypothetical protein